MHRRHLTLVVILFLGCGDPFEEEALLELVDIDYEEQRLDRLYSEDSSKEPRLELLDDYRDLASKVAHLKSEVKARYTGSKYLDLIDKVNPHLRRVTSRLHSLESIEARNLTKECWETCRARYTPCWEDCGCAEGRDVTEVRWTTHTYGTSHPLRGMSLNEYPDLCHETYARSCKAEKCLTFQEYEQCHIDCISH